MYSDNLEFASSNIVVQVALPSKIIPLFCK
jgi:hypothetical protein